MSCCAAVQCVRARALFLQWTRMLEGGASEGTLGEESTTTNPESRLHMPRPSVVANGASKEAF